jgi:hypothetical protein
LDVVALFLWIFTAAAGLHLLAAGKPARRSSGSEPEATEPVLAAPAGAAAGGPAPEAVPAAYAGGSGVPPITHTRITTRPDEHPLLEFMHPALAMAGLGCWVAFVVTRFHTFAWLAFGVIVVTIGAGISWLIRSTLAGRRHPGSPGPLFPPRLIMLHGSAAALTLVLAFVTALIAGRP